MKLRQAIDRYIRLKQSLGFRFATDGQILKAFSHAVGRIQMGKVRPVPGRVYLDGNGSATRNWERKWVALRGFYEVALARGWVRRSPLPAWAPKAARVFTPYIYSIGELRRLHQAIPPEGMVKGLSAPHLSDLAAAPRGGFAHP